MAQLIEEWGSCVASLKGLNLFSESFEGRNDSACLLFSCTQVKESGV